MAHPTAQPRPPSRLDAALVPSVVELIRLFSSRAKGTHRPATGIWGSPTATPLNAYLQDRHQQLRVERLLHLSVDAASDLLERLLVQELNSKPQTDADTFLLAGAAGSHSTGADPDLPGANLRSRSGLLPPHDRRRR